MTSATLQSIAVTPSTDTIARGAKVHYTATGTFSDGSMQDITTQAIWTSSMPGVAMVSNIPGSEGVATATAAGTTTIRATRGTISGTATLTVQQ